MEPSSTRSFVWSRVTASDAGSSAGAGPLSMSRSRNMGARQRSQRSQRSQCRPPMIAVLLRSFPSFNRQGWMSPNLHRPSTAGKTRLVSGSCRPSLILPIRVLLQIWTLGGIRSCRRLTGCRWTTPLPHHCGLIDKGLWSLFLDREESWMRPISHRSRSDPFPTGCITSEIPMSSR
jgi:hypothetical protein